MNIGRNQRAPSLLAVDPRQVAGIACELGGVVAGFMPHRAALSAGHFPSSQLAVRRGHRAPVSPS
jgi:hypothetical protein